MSKPSNAGACGYPEKYERLRKELGGTEWVALGSLIERGEPGQGGPRYQWSRRAGGKTVTVVKNFVGIGLPEKEKLAKEMRKACGTGGTTASIIVAARFRNRPLGC